MWTARREENGFDVKGENELKGRTLTCSRVSTVRAALGSPALQFTAGEG